MTKSVLHHRTRIALIPAMLLTLGLASACGSNSEDTANAANPGDKSALGPANAATGDTVKVGYLETGQTAAIDTTNEDKAVTAAAKYANEHLGGLGGHKIEIVVCETKGTPSGSQECGSKFVREGVVAVTGAQPGEPAGVLDQLKSTDIPFTANLMADQAVLAAPNSFVFGNPLAVFGTPAQYGKEESIKSVAVIGIDVPGLAGPMKTIAPLIFGNAGMKMDAVLVAPGTADMTPQIQGAKSKKPGMWYIFGDPTHCSGAAKAMQTLAVSEPIVASVNCIGADGGAGLPGIEKMKIVTGFSSDPTSEDWKLFTAILKEYGNDIPADPFAVTGYQGFMSLVGAVNAAKPTEVTAKAVSEAIKTAPAVPYPLGGGVSIQCNGKAVALSPNICSAGGLIADANSDGTLKNFKALDAGALYVPPAA